MTSQRPARRWAALAVAALALLALAVVRSGGGGPPLYDGICLPPHYLSLGASPGPGSGSATYSADELAQTQELGTSDQTPQAQAIIAAGSLTSPAGASVTVTITPVPAPSVKPAGGSIVGNVYQFSARASTGQAVNLAPGHPATIVLAAPSMGGPQLTLDRFDASTGTWTPLKTFQSGCGDTEEAASPSLGLFALVGQGSSGPAPAGGGGPPVPLIVAGVVIIVLGLVIGATRRSRRRR